MRRGLIARSKTELPDAVFDARLERLRAAMAGLDALLVYTNNTRPAGVSWLVGVIPHLSEAMLVLPPSGAPVLVVAFTFPVNPWSGRTSRGAEEVYVAAAPDLARDRRLMRIEGGSPALGARFAVRASVAYKGNWVRRVVTIDRDLTPARTGEAAAAFAEAVALLPNDRALSQFASFVGEGCRLGQPREAVRGSHIA